RCAGRHHHRRGGLCRRRLPQPPKARPTCFSRSGEGVGCARWRPGSVVRITCPRRRGRHRNQRRLEMRRSLKIATAGVALFGLLALAGCTTDPAVVPGATEDPGEPPAGVDNEWFDQALFDKQYAERGVAPQGPADEPYLQHINAE